MTPKCILWALVAGAIAMRGLAAESAASSDPVPLDDDISYARSDDVVRWTDSAGRPRTLPIAVETGEIIDEVPPGGGLLNMDREPGFDHAGPPAVNYHKYSVHGDPQVYAARRDTSGWNIVQVIDWKGSRWDFGGGGTIVAEVKVDAGRPLGEGRPALSYSYPRGTGVWGLDESSLGPIPGATAPREEAPVPSVFAQVESAFPGTRKQIRPDTGRGPAGTRFAITWETLEFNRDRPRSPPWPEPSMLRVIRTGKTQSQQETNLTLPTLPARSSPLCESD